MNCCSRHGKIRKHASNSCGQFLKKLRTFLDRQQFSCSFYPSMHTSLHYYPQFCQKIFEIMEKIAILYTFLCLGTIWVCGHFQPGKLACGQKWTFSMSGTAVCLIRQTKGIIEPEIFKSTKFPFNLFFTHLTMLQHFVSIYHWESSYIRRACHFICNTCFQTKYWDIKCIGSISKEYNGKLRIQTPTIVPLLPPALQVEVTYWKT